MTCGLYCITNKINGKKYFGQSTNIEERKKAYFNYGDFPNDHIKNAFNKYGEENFEFKIIKVCKEKYLDRFEKLYIRINDTQNPNKGYNKESGGNPNKTLSEETKQKMSEAKSGENNWNYRYDLDDDVLRDEYVNQRLSCGEIAIRHNTNPNTIIYRLNKLGIDTSRDRYCSRDDLKDDVLRDEYVNQELSCREIARRHNTTLKTITYRLNKLGIDTSRNKAFRDDLDDDVLRDEYVNQRLSCGEIAIRHNTYSKTITYRLNKLGIDTSRDAPKNTTGYYRVSKYKDPKYKQGFIWKYQYNENGKRKCISSIDLKKLEEKVKKKGLTWKKM